MTRCTVESALVAFASGLACLGLVGATMLALHHTVPDWLLPGSVLIAVLVLCQRRGPATTLAPAPGRSLWLLLLFVGLVALLIGHGAMATASRHWDGAVMWDVKTQALAAAPTLEQPFFRDPAIYCHSRDYPLLQPLTMALAERWSVPPRLLFVLAMLAFVGAVLAAARAAGHGTARQSLLAAAALSTPMLLAPTSGGFDSGYGDGLLAAAMAVVAFGLVSRTSLAIAAGCTLVILQKPEGLPYCLALTAVCWLVAERSLLLPVLCSTAVAGGIGTWLRRDLDAFGQPANMLLLAGVVIGAPLVLIVLDAALRARRRAIVWRLALLLLAVPLSLIASSSAAELASPAWSRLDRLPRILSALAGWMFGDRFALTFWLAALLAVLRLRQRPTGDVRALALWLLSALPIACLPFLLLPIDDLEHHLRSTMPRVLMHWTGVAWVYIASTTADLRARQTTGTVLVA